MGETCPIMGPGTARRFMLLGLLSLLALCAQLLVAGRAGSPPHPPSGSAKACGLTSSPHWNIPASRISILRSGQDAARSRCRLARPADDAD